MINRHISASDASKSVIGDDIWACEPMDLEKKGCPKFKLGAYDWLVELKPRDDFKGFLFGPLVDSSRHLRVVNEETDPCRRNPWVRLFTPVERFGYDVHVVLMMRDRLDTMMVDYISTVGGKSISTKYEAKVYASVDTMKFYKFLSIPGSKERVLKILSSEIQYQLECVNGDINKRLVLQVSNPFLTEAGYIVEKVEMRFLNSKEVAA